MPALKVGSKIRVLGTYWADKVGIIKNPVACIDRRAGVVGDWWVEFRGDVGTSFWSRELELLVIEHQTPTQNEQREMF